MLYKIFTKITNNRIPRILDEKCSQAGFRKHFSTIDHINAVNQLMERTGEYNNNIELIKWAWLYRLREGYWFTGNSSSDHYCKKQGVPLKYIIMFVNKSEIYYSVSEINYNVNYNVCASEPVHIQRGVRLGDSISPKLSQPFLNKFPDIWSGKIMEFR